MNEQPRPAIDDPGTEHPGTEHPGTEHPGVDEPIIAEPIVAESNRPRSTGHPAVDAALEALAQVATAPPADQVPAYQAAQRTLRESLDSIDEQ